MRKPRDEKFITIKEVAIEANVSIATVSRVMNNGKVSEVRRKRVLDAMRELNYVPNNSARNLASVNATKRIKVIVPNIDMHCYTELIKGFKKGAHLYKYDPIVEDYANDELLFEKINDSMIASSEIKGVVQVGPNHDLPNKVIVNLNDEMLEITPGEKFKNQSIGVFFPRDEYMSHYFRHNIFKKQKTSDIQINKLLDLDIYITQNIEQAAKLINMGITKPIFTLENSPEIEKIISNIHYFPVDFYAVGLALSRICIKKITGTLNEDDASLVLEIK